jgi:uncharacterized membrane protein
MSALAIALHALASTVWVGGMFLAYVVLRPSFGALAASDRLALWQRVFERFFKWVIAAIAVLLVSGYWLLFVTYGGFGGAGVHIHIMHLTGWLMFLLFFHLFFVPWKRYQRALAANDNAGAGRWLGQIRLIVAVNLALGLATAAIGASGRFWYF